MMELYKNLKFYKKLNKLHVFFILVSLYN